MAWETFAEMSDKVFDSLSESEKKDIFLNTIEEIEQNEDFQKLRKYRDRLDEDEKVKYYRDWDIIRLLWAAKHVRKINKPLNPFHMKEEARDRGYEVASPLIRLWVSFWLLDAPEAIKEREILNNVKKDASRLKRDLVIFEKVCAAVPQLNTAYPIIKAIKPYAKWYEKEWVPLMQERIKNKNIEKTRNELADVLSADADK